MAPPKPPRFPGESTDAYNRRIASAAERIPVHEMRSGDTPEELPTQPAWRGRTQGHHTPPPFVYSPLPEAPHHLSENTKVLFTLGRTIVTVASVFVAGWFANSKVGEVLNRQDRMDQRLGEVLTKRDLAEAEMRIERRLLDRLNSRGVLVSCPVLTVRGQTHKPCDFLGLTETRQQEEGR